MPIVVEEVQAEVEAPPAQGAAAPPPAAPLPAPQDLLRELARLLGRAERLHAD
jgi:hypothetical protein